MSGNDLVLALGGLDERYVDEALNGSFRRGYRKWLAAAACVLLLLGAGLWLRDAGVNGGSGLFDNGYFVIPDKRLYPVQREAVTPEPEAALIGVDDEIKKVYEVRWNNWYLSQKLTDFSQIIDPSRVFYVANSADARAYSTYRVRDDGTVELNGAATGSARGEELPIGFMGLTYDVIGQDIGGLPCDDYIITYSGLLRTVFVWVRSAEGDHIVAYPTRPEFVNLENRGVYTLDELKASLAEAYREEN